MVGWVDEGSQWCGAKDRCLMTKTFRATELDRGLCLGVRMAFCGVPLFFLFSKKKNRRGFF